MGLEEYEYIEDGLSKAYDINKEEIKSGDVINNGIIDILVTTGIYNVLIPFFTESKFSIEPLANSTKQPSQYLLSSIF